LISVWSMKSQLAIIMSMSEMAAQKFWGEV